MTFARLIRPAASATFDPATLSLSGWWRASYTGLPWAPTASAGSSGSNGSFVTNLDDPNIGTSLNGYDCANFDGIGHNAKNNTDITSFVTTTAGSLIVLFQGDAQDAPTGSIYNDTAIFRDSNADFGMTYTTSGVTAFAYDGAYKTKSVTCNTGAPHLIMMTVNGTNLAVTIDSAAEVTQACGTLSALTGSLSLGVAYGGATSLNGRIWEVMTSTSVLNSTNYGNIKSYVNSRYGLAL